MQEQKTQIQEILEDLKADAQLSAMDALSRYGCLRLGARIYDLRRMGYPINTSYKVVTTSRGKQTTVAIYSMGDRNGG